MAPSWTTSLSVAALCLPGVLAAPVFESLHGVPNGWRFARSAHGGERIKLKVALKQQNVELFEQRLLDMSSPDHPSYGQHMQGEEVQALLKPEQAATDAVISWLQDHNVTRIEDESDWVHFTTDVGTANRMLDTEFHWYYCEEQGAERLRTLRYAVPEAVAGHINLVQPTTRFGSLRSLGSTLEVLPTVPDLKTLVTSTKGGAVDPACNSSITPQCLLQLYNVHYKADPKNGNKVGYGSFLEEYARYGDLALFEANIATYAAGENFTVTEFHGGLNDQASADDSGEANLDNQYIVGVGYPVPVTEFSTGGRGPLIPDLDQPDPADNGNEPYLDYLQGVLKLPNSQLPQTISHSYGEDEQSVPKSFALQVCNMFAQLGARGVSVIFSSGDNGVGTACQSNDGKNTTEFQPQFPAACPWVTSVGSTRYIEPEVATYFSSGGFSRVWSRPIWQARAVDEYLAKIGDKFSKYYNKNGRGFPDVAAQGYGFAVYDKGVLKHYQGTSCSAPTFAAIVSLLNAARISSHLPPLGYLNPWIYGVAAHAFNDITHGGSTGCDGMSRFHGPPNGSPVIPYASFNATQGWDAVTGLGTPDFDKLLKLSTPWVKNQGGPVPA